MALLDAFRDARQRRRLILAALWLFIIGVLAVFRQVLIIFAVAAVIAYVLQPIVTRMSSWSFRGFRPPRWSCVVALYALFFLAIYLFTLTVAPQVAREVRRLTTDTAHFVSTLTPERIQGWEQSVQDFVEEHGIPLDFGPADEAEPGKMVVSIDFAHAVRDVLEKSSDEIRTSLPRVVGYAQTLVGQTLSLVFTFFFTLMVAAFMLVDWEEIKAYFFSLLPGEHRDRQDSLLARIDSGLSGVVRGQLVICLINGSLTLVGLLVFKVKFAFVLSGVATVLSLVPVFGSIFSSVPIVIVGLTQGWKTGIGALAWIVGIHAFEAYFLNPKIMGAAAKIHPLVVAFALVAGERTYGFAGALFAVPLASVIVNLFKALHAYALEGTGEVASMSPVAAVPRVTEDKPPSAAAAG